MMQIKDLQPRQGKVELVGKVVEKGDVREIAKPNFSGQVCNAKLQDETGSIKLSLWNEQVGQVAVGDTIKISNGYVSEYQGEMQLSTGKFGSLEIVEKGADAPAAAEPAPQAPEAPSAAPSAPEPAPVAEEPLNKFGAEEEVIQ